MVWPPKKIVIVPDKFKGGSSSYSVARSIKEGIELALDEQSANKPSIKIFPISDGGDGSLEIFRELSMAKEVTCAASPIIGNIPLPQLLDNFKDFLSRGADAQLTNIPYAITNSNSAFIEVAKVCGLAMVAPQKSIIYSTSAPLGDAIYDAIQRGVKEITIGLGGSATNDYGMGLILQLLRRSGVKSDFPFCKEAVSHAVKGVKFRVVCDVANPLFGENGAARSFAPQKGASQKEIEELEALGERFVERILSAEKSDRVKKCALSSGAGAAGGLGFALQYFFDAEYCDGYKFFSNAYNLESELNGADLVISAEGRFDNQSLKGKVIGGLMQQMRSLETQKQRELWIICGESALEGENSENYKVENGDVKIYQLCDIEKDIEARKKIENKLLRQISYLAAVEANFYI